jgi:hypothetical protein
MKIAVCQSDKGRSYGSGPENFMKALFYGFALISIFFILIIIFESLLNLLSVLSIFP